MSDDIDWIKKEMGTYMDPADEKKQLDEWVNSDSTSFWGKVIAIASSVTAMILGKMLYEWFKHQ